MKFLSFLRTPMFQTLFALRGNPRACVYTEPLFGIPSNFFFPYASVYMLALGVQDQQIGLIASLGLVLQVFTALISGAITDKFGRRLTLFIMDILSWALPCLIWAIAQDIRYFIFAAVLNSLWRISHTAWSCLMVEDADSEQIVHIWTWVYIFATGSAFFAPIAGLLVKRFDLVPAVRVFYIFGFLVLGLKSFVLYKYSTETKRGAERREETRHQSLIELMSEYGGVLKQLLQARATLVAVAFLVILSICQNINSSFMSILITQKLLIPNEHLTWFTFTRSVVLLASFFWLTPRLSASRFKPPMALGFAFFLTSLVMLVTMPPQNYLLLVLATILEAIGYAIVTPLLDSLLVLAMDPGERARLTALVYVGILLCTSPFGWIAGQLSAINRIFPFILNIVLLSFGMLLLMFGSRLLRKPTASLEKTA